MSVRRPKVAILGAGTVGLSVAHELASMFDVTIFAERIGVETNSVKATAMWHIFLVPETAQVLDWGKITLQRFLDLEKSTAQSGMETITGVELFRAGEAHTPSWAHIPPHFKLLNEVEIASYNDYSNKNLSDVDRVALEAKPILWGYTVSVPAVDMRTYLTWLESEVRIRGVSIERRLITSLDELSAAFDVVVNCSGLEAAQLCNDSDFEVYKGQYYVLNRSDDCPPYYIGDDDHPLGMAYAIPRGNEVLVGGSAERGIVDMTPTLSFEEIQSRASLYFPWIRTKTRDDIIRGPVVCLRPVRHKGIRFETDSTSSGMFVIHNYGHGGSGWSLSWGCAQSVEKLLRARFDL